MKKTDTGQAEYRKSKDLPVTCPHENLGLRDTLLIIIDELFFSQMNEVLFQVRSLIIIAIYFECRNVHNLVLQSSAFFLQRNGAMANKK